MVAFVLDPSPFPKGPHTPHLRTLVPNSEPGMAFGARVLKWRVSGPCGFVSKGSGTPVEIRMSAP